MSFESSKKKRFRYLLPAAATTTQVYKNFFFLYIIIIFGINEECLCRGFLFIFYFCVMPLKNISQFTSLYIESGLFIGNLICCLL